jgi:hypothetical protein
MMTTKIFRKNFKITKSIADFKVYKNRKKTKVEYMKNITNLPNEIRNKVMNAISEFPPQYTECVLYSQYIASSIPNVKVEMGLYIKDDLHKNIPIDFSQYDSNSWVKFDLDDFSSTSFVDENKEVWGIHCWNSYNGIHFDCMKDFLYKIDDKRVWIDYQQLQSVNFDFPNYKSMKEYRNTIKSFILVNRQN